jgi:8-oxo-dGTP pyrophosphatase MutT (NUDIX family)
VTAPEGEHLRAAVRASVAALAARDERERVSQARILQALDHMARPFDEAADPVHVTGSAVVVSGRGVLLHRHKRLGLWLQPGGHVDPGETPWQAALRETREETGLPARHPDGHPLLWHVDVHDGGRGHTHLDLRYLLLAPPEDPRPPPQESPAVGWFAWPDARRVADPGLVAALDPAAERLAARAD